MPQQQVQTQYQQQYGKPSYGKPSYGKSGGGWYPQPNYPWWSGSNQGSGGMTEIPPNTLPLGSASRGLQAPSAGAETAAWFDPGFAPFVDLRLLGQAWAENDASTLADIGLAMARAEQILGRPHKAIATDKLLAEVIRISAEKRDAPTLQRLAKGLAENRELAAKASDAVKRMGANPAEARKPEATKAEIKKVNEIAPKQQPAAKSGAGAESPSLDKIAAGSRDAGQPRPRHAANWGFEYRLVPTSYGHCAEIARVDAESPAARIDFEPGDRIVSINAFPIRQAEDVEAVRGLVRFAVMDARTGQVQWYSFTLP